MGTPGLNIQAYLATHWSSVRKWAGIVLGEPVIAFQYPTDP